MGTLEQQKKIVRSANSAVTSLPLPSHFGTWALSPEMLSGPRDFE